MTRSTMKFYKREILSTARYWVIVMPIDSRGVTLTTGCKLFETKRECAEAIAALPHPEMFVSMCVRLVPNTHQPEQKPRAKVATWHLARDPKVKMKMLA